MILVIGAGVAGLSCAIAAAAAGAEVELVAPGVLGRTAETNAAEANAAEPNAAEGAGGDAGGGAAAMAARVLAGGSTALAQGGIAAALDADDSAALHLADTVAAGAGIVDAEAADVLVSEGALAMRRLIEEGFAIDREADGRPGSGSRRRTGCGGSCTRAETRPEPCCTPISQRGCWRTSGSGCSRGARSSR
ncbi:FAD-binding protein [Leucobacter soli]|uniref:FAD-binding protein n=1 Tax=Leucobacter soli TaxID=2812850 RepID=UPI003605F7B1